MGLKFVSELPEDEVNARANHPQNERELKSNPGKWGQIAEYSARATATSFRSKVEKREQKYKGRPVYDPAYFEIEVRTKNTGSDDEKHLVFARYIGDVDVVEDGEFEDGEFEGDEQDDSAPVSAPGFSG